MIEWLLAGAFCLAPQQCIQPRSFGKFQTEEVCIAHKNDAFKEILTFMRKNGVTGVIIVQCISRETKGQPE